MPNRFLSNNGTAQTLPYRKQKTVSPDLQLSLVTNFCSFPPGTTRSDLALSCFQKGYCHTLPPLVPPDHISLFVVFIKDTATRYPRQQAHPLTPSVLHCIESHRSTPQKTTGVQALSPKHQTEGPIEGLNVRI